MSPGGGAGRRDAGPVPTVSITLPSFGSAVAGDPLLPVRLAGVAEQSGVDRVVLTDHVLLGRRTDAYSWGRFPQPPDAPWLEPLTTLAAIAATTNRIRLGTGVLIAPLRPAVVLAKTVATLDGLSAGRVDLGVGVGWQREEFAAAGLDFERRGQLLTDTIAACRALWSELPAAVERPTIAFDEVFSAPLPVQTRLPVWFSGTLGRRNLERIVTLGDGWIPIMGATVADIASGAALLRDRFHDAGRDPDRLDVQAPLTLPRTPDGDIDTDRTVLAVHELITAGVTDISVNLRALDPQLSDPGAAMVDLVDIIRHTR